MSEVYGDAFKDDKREEKLYGEPIVVSDIKLVYDQLTDIPESKSNNVSFMKVEELPLLCRNILAVSESYICYSVTQKKNLLRVIDTQLGDKVILRGHEHAVLDLRFAAMDAGLLCSVDSGGSDEVSGKPHIIVWKKQEQQAEWKIFAELPIRASMVRPHPTQAHVWAVAHQNKVAVFSSQRSAATQQSVSVCSFEALPMHLALPSGQVVKDMCFSTSGRHLVIAAQQERDAACTLLVYKLAGQQQGGADGTLQRVFQAEVPVAQFIALQWTQDVIITASASASASSTDTVGYTVNVWRCAVEEAAAGSGAWNLNTPVQTVTLQLPRAKNTPLSPVLECALSLEPRQQRYLLLTSRCSNLVTCLAVNPSLSKTSHPCLQGQPLYHATWLNLRAPVISFDVTTVLGQAHHSAEAGEHLEVSCYQETASEPGQASIQQYHVLFAHLFHYPTYCALPEVSRSVPAAPLAELLQGSPVKGRAEVQHTPVRSAVDNSAPASASNKGMTILNMLNSYNRSTGDTSSSPVTPTAQLHVPGIVRPTPSPAVAVAPTPSPSAAVSNGAGKSLLSMLGGKPAVTASAAPPSTTEGLPDFLLKSQPSLNSSILDVLKAASSAKHAAHAIPAAAPSLQVPHTPTTPLAAASPATTSSKTVTPAPVTSSSISASVSASANGGATATKNKAAPMQATAAQSTHANTANHTASAGSNAEVAHLTGAVRELQLALGTTNAIQAQLQTQYQQQAMQTAKQLTQVVKDVQAGQAKQNEALVAAVRKALEGEAKRSQEQNSVSSGSMKVELSEQILRELVPTISSKIKDSVKDTVREAVKAQLPAAFRDSFESALLPAFEAGAQSMFQQLQGAFVQGMQGVLQEGLRVQQRSAANTEKLELEMRELRDTVSRLENQIGGLTQLVEALCSNAGALQQQDQAATPVEDAFTLLKQGRISEAVVRVLEDKDIRVTVSLLEQLTPQQVTNSCSHLERLCITQQLAADMSVNVPIEGIGKRIDWIKHLVLSLLSGHNPLREDANYESHFKAMIAVVLDSISAAKKLIFSAQYDTGEDDALSLQIPHSVGTDLQLLEFVIQSKM